MAVMGADPIRPIESVVDDWSALVGDVLLNRIVRRCVKMEHPELDSIRAYLEQPDVRRHREADELVWRPEDASN